MSNGCIFCKIISGEIPSAKIMENDRVLAILDINPVNNGHVLVMPKTHAENLEAVSEEDLTAIIKAVKTVGAAIKIGLDYQGYNVTENNDPVAGQLIPHLHFHVIPRTAEDGLRLWPQQQYASPEEMKDVAEKIKAAL